MADTIKIGNLDISAFKVGSGDCKVYLGDTLLYPPSYKLIAQYSDSTEYKVECNNSSSLVQNEVRGGNYTAYTSVILGDCITSLGPNAFLSASTMTSITFPTGLTEVANACFRYANGIKNINNLPSSLTTIGSGAFADMGGLTAATIPSSVTTIASNLFLRDSALKEVHFQGTTPPSVGADAFNGCTSLIKIYIPNCNCYDSYAAQSQFSGKTDIIYAEDNTKCYVPPHVYFNYVNGQYERGGFSYTANSDNNLTTILKTASSSGELTTCNIAASGVTSVKFTQVNAVSGSGFYYSATIGGNTVTAYTNSSGAVQEFTGLSKYTTYHISVTLRKKTNGSGISGTNASANITWTQ